MRSEARVFNLVAAFLYLVGGTYAWWTEKESTIEWVGTIALVLSGTLTAMCGFYFGFVARRIPPRPEDRHDGNISEGAGEVGFFSPGSYWPLGIGLAAGTAALGLAFALWWLVAVGLLAVLMGALGLLSEYYTGTRDYRI
jgi:membrane-associated phospholipid phosphatase